MHRSVIIGLLLLTAGLGVATLNNIISHAMGQEYDNYYGASSYSKYPTNDKKYGCRIGPFEGFFVSSVEFCKHVKFDDSKRDHSRDNNNRTVTQGQPGPQGPQGVPGLTGPQGPSGITQLNATNVYLVQNSSGPAVPGGSFAFVSALCDRVDLLLNGGYNLLGSILRNNDSVTTAIDQPIVAPMFPILNENLGAGWITFVRINEDPSSSELRLNVFAICFDNPPAHIP